MRLSAPIQPMGDDVGEQREKCEEEGTAEERKIPGVAPAGDSVGVVSDLTEEDTATMRMNAMLATKMRAG